MDAAVAFDQIERCRIVLVPLETIQHDANRLDVFSVLDLKGG
jgi:hypothetical protein